MKQFMSIIISFWFMSLLSAQSKYGIVTYSVPSGWEVTKNASGVTLENKQEKRTTCSITLSETNNFVINSEAGFLKRVNTKKMSEDNLDKSTVDFTESTNTICYGIKGTTVIKGTSVNLYLFSVTNRQKTFFVRFTSRDDACKDAFKNFWNALLIDPKEESSGDTSGYVLRAKRKSAGGAAPAAPAPVM